MIKTERLILRRWKLADEANLARHCNTPEVMKWLGGVMSEEVRREEFRWLRFQQRLYGHTFWAMELRQTGKLLGFCGLTRVDEADSTVLDCLEIGWRVRVDAQRKGYAKEAATACLEHAFDELGALRVVSRTRLENAASHGLMRALHMRHDPRLDYITQDGTPLIVHVRAPHDG